jgi:hypothetical protein
VVLKLRQLPLAAAAYVTVVALAACAIDVTGSLVAPGLPAEPADEAEAGATSDADAPRGDDGGLVIEVDAGPEPLNTISPYHPSGTLTYQLPIDWTIASADATAVIRYTTDGSAPGPTAKTAVGKVTLSAVPDGTTIRWVVLPGTLVHTFDVKVDPALSSSTQGFVDRVAFDASSSPVVRVRPGATVTGTVRSFVWNAPVGCPSCIDQVLVGVTTAEDCVTDTNPRTHPGSTRTNVPFSIKAPETPGVYTVKTGFTQQFRCTPDAIGKGLGATVIGTLVVE